MNTSQMLRRSDTKVSSPAPAPEPGPEKHTTAVDHVIKILAPPALKGLRLKRAEAEPWLIEQLERGNCPTCMFKLLHMRSIADPSVNYYTCEENPREHRWDIVD